MLNFEKGKIAVSKKDFWRTEDMKTARVVEGIFKGFEIYVFEDEQNGPKKVRQPALLVLNEKGVWVSRVLPGHSGLVNKLIGEKTGSGVRIEFVEEIKQGDRSRIVYDVKILTPEETKSQMGEKYPRLGLENKGEDLPF